MANLHLVLYVLAFVCFLLAALDVEAPRRRLGWAGLACWVLTYIV